MAFTNYLTQSCYAEYFFMVLVLACMVNYSDMKRITWLLAVWTISNRVESCLAKIFPVWTIGMGVAKPDLLEEQPMRRN
jgi:hypothetical protein